MEARVSTHDRRETRYIIAHGTATGPYVASPSTNRRIVERIRAEHRRRGFRAIGYHWLVAPDGEILPGRPEHEIGAHARGWNSVSIGVALIGGLDADRRPDPSAYTPEQLRSFWALIEAIAARHPGAVICGHRDLSPDGDGDGAIEPHEWTTLCPLIDVIPEAARRGLPVPAIGSDWSRTDARRPRRPDERTAYLQRLLKRWGAQIVDDGVEGAQTREAIRAFQRAMALPQSGRFDRVTVDRLRAEVLDDVVVVTQAPIEGLDRSAWRSGEAWSAKLLGAATAALAWWSELPLEAKIVAMILGAVLVGYLWREQTRRAEAARRAAEGDPSPQPRPDFFDWFFAVLRSIGAPRPEATGDERG